MGLYTAEPSCQHWRLTAGLIFSLLLNILVLCLAVYGSQVILDMKNDIRLLQADKANCRESQPLIRREILSGSKKPQGGAQKPGGQGFPENDRRDDDSFSMDGVDFSKLQSLMNSAINETVKKEWTSLSGKLPNYGGAAYTRWGRKTCSSSSKLIYSGQMAAPDQRSHGGGVNPLCLPSDPQYDEAAPPEAHFATITALQLEIGSYPNLFPTYTHRTPAACTVCESGQRLTKLMMPAAVTCPDSSWQLEYKGYLMSAANINGRPDDAFIVGHFKTTYLCVDQQPESFASNIVNNGWGAELHFNRVKCSGEGALGNCPPYQIHKALSCVVCTK